MLISSGNQAAGEFCRRDESRDLPMFFASSALYPLWRVQEGSPLLYYVCLFNPFTHAVELIRFALYGQTNWIRWRWWPAAAPPSCWGRSTPTIHRAA